MRWANKKDIKVPSQKEFWKPVVAKVHSDKAPQGYIEKKEKDYHIWINKDDDDIVVVV